jgi:hypothetical protein
MADAIKKRKPEAVIRPKFFEFNQNNSGGRFTVNKYLCHRLIIEADCQSDAIHKAETLGCYWNGVEDGLDCSCCGDRWYMVDMVDFDKINNLWGGYEVSAFTPQGKKSEWLIDILKKRYAGATWLTPLSATKKYGSMQVIGKVKIDSIELYAQIIADLWGSTTPDIRIFYKDGTVKEINKTPAIL